MADFIDYVLRKNGKQNTAKNILILVLAPWAMLVFAIAMNFIARLLRGADVNAQYVGIPAVIIGCTLFSTYNVAMYILKWWKLYQKQR